MMPALWAASLLSGLAALVYQVLWSRELSLVLGTSTEAVSVVLSSFMAGLGLGNALAARWLERSPAGGDDSRRLARAYAALEGLIGVAAILLPFALPRLSGWLAPLYVDGVSPLAFRVARTLLAFALLAVPTTAMGATLPVLIALARPEASRIGATSGALYAANTVGAVVGALLTPLVLLPTVGLGRARLVAVAANAAAAIVVLRSPLVTNGAARQTDPPREGGMPTASRLALVAVLLSGLGALAQEVAWTRALVLLVGPTAYAFAFVVAAVIAGLAAGSAIASRFVDRLAHPARALAAVQVGIVAWALVLVPLVGFWP